MAELTTDVNWLAVIVGAVLAFLLGWLWYSPMLFGKKWAEGHGVEMGSASSMPMAAMGMQGLGLLLASWFVGVTAVSSSLGTFILAFVAFAVLHASNCLFAKKSSYVVMTESGYWIASGVVMFIVQAIL